MDKGSAIRTIVLVLALINQLLTSSGLNPVPGTEELWGEVIVAGITGSAAVWAWFKNNYVTAKGKRQKEELKRKGLTEAK